MIHTTSQVSALSRCVGNELEKYFENLGGYATTGLYEMVVGEVECSLLREVLKYTKGNQSNAAVVLGINRGTLRKKMKQYNLEVRGAGDTGKQE